jgi:hypothetical protein
MKMSKYLCLLIGMGLLMGLMPLMRSQVPQDWATVTGRVLDADGRPLPGARISIFPLDVGISGGMPRQPITDQDGNYSLVAPAYPGRTRLCAVKESAGYPDIQDSLFLSPTDGKLPEVSMTPGGHLENVDIHLGPPDGTAEGFVIDAETRTPVSKARITLHRSDSESMYSTSLPPDGHFFYALPPAPIEITIVAPGYLPWTYKDAHSTANRLVLSPSEHREITVELIGSKANGDARGERSPDPR